MNTKARPSLIVVALMAAAIAGCATNTARPQADSTENDPLEPLNRKVYAFNEGLDDYAIGPASRAWTAVTPNALREGVSNFFDNLAYPGVLVNDLLQAKFGYAAQDTMRFAVNSTLGLAGFFDPASSMGLQSRAEDFGQTLGYWGTASGPYLEVPVFGPSSARDVTRYPVGYYTNVITYVALDTATLGGLTAINVVNTRAELDGAVRLRNEAALDPYAFTRSTYRQYRRNQVYDGNPPETEDPYAEMFESLDASADSTELSE